MLQINVQLHHLQVKREHWGFDDPAKAEGTDEENGHSFNVFVMKLVKESNVLLKQVNNKYPRE